VRACTGGSSEPRCRNRAGWPTATGPGLAARRASRGSTGGSGVVP